MQTFIVIIIIHRRKNLIALLHAPFTYRSADCEKLISYNRILTVINYKPSFRCVYILSEFLLKIKEEV